MLQVFPEWDFLKDRGWGAKRIGVEMDNYWFTARAYAALQAGLPDAKFSDTTGLVTLVYGKRPFAEAEAAGALRLQGDRELAERFVDCFLLPDKLAA